jgi:hypothetical protein
VPQDALNETRLNLAQAELARRALVCRVPAFIAGLVLLAGLVLTLAAVLRPPSRRGAEPGAAAVNTPQLPASVLKRGRPGQGGPQGVAPSRVPARRAALLAPAAALFGPAAPTQARLAASPR